VTVSRSGWCARVGSPSGVGSAIAASAGCGAGESGRRAASRAGRCTPCTAAVCCRSSDRDRPRERFWASVSSARGSRSPRLACADLPRRRGKPGQELFLAPVCYTAREHGPRVDSGRRREDRLSAIRARRSRARAASGRRGSDRDCPGDLPGAGRPHRARRDPARARRSRRVPRDRSRPRGLPGGPRTARGAHGHRLRRPSTRDILSEPAALAHRGGTGVRPRGARARPRPRGAARRARGGRTLREPGDVRVRERCLATTDAERYSAAREAIPELSVEIVEDAQGWPNSPGGTRR